MEASKIHPSLILLIFSVFALAVIFLPAFESSAQPNYEFQMDSSGAFGSGGSGNTGAQVQDINTQVRGTNVPALTNPLKYDNLEQFIKALLGVVMKVGIVVAGLFIIWSGFLFVTARGSEEQIKKAKQVFFWTIIGTAILVGAQLIADILRVTVEQLKR